MKPIMYDMSSMADSLAARHNKFAFAHDIKEIDYKEAFFLCFNFIEDVMTTFMAWLDNTDYFSIAMEKIGHQWYCDDSELGSLYYFDVLDILFLKTCDYFQTFIPTTCWDVWKVYRSGPFAIFTNGGDYRVAEWEKMLHAGKIQPPSKKVILPKPPTPKKVAKRQNKKTVFKGTQSYIDDFNKA